MMMNASLPAWPQPVAELVDQMAGFFPLCKRVVETWERLECVRGDMPKHLQMPDHSWPELPEDLKDRGEFYKWQTDNRREYKPSLGAWTQLLLAEDCVRFEIRLWRAALDGVRDLLPTVIGWMDDPTKPAYLRWSAEVSEQLAAMGGLINRYTAEDPPSSLDVEAFGRCYNALWQRFRELKRVVGGPVVVVRQVAPDGRGASPSEPGSLPKRPSGPRISKDEANVKARELLAKDKSFAEKTAREWAEEIVCSVGLVAELPTWKAVQERKKKSAPPRRANVVSLTPEVQATHGVGKKDEILTSLIAEQDEELRSEEKHGPRARPDR